jgi:hypothetical protein
MSADSRAGSRIEFNMLRPEPSNEGPIEVRRENLVTFGICFIHEPDISTIPLDKEKSLGPYIRVLDNATEAQTSSQDSVIYLRQPGLILGLEVHGATTGTAFVSACHKCSTKDPSALPNWSLFDFAAKGGLVGITGGMARVAFRFRCLPFHHGTTDREYRYNKTSPLSTLPILTTPLD